MSDNHSHTRPIDGDALSSLDELIVDVATSLMGVGPDEVQTTTDQRLGVICDFFGVDHVFLRRHDHEAGVSIMVGEQPPRTDIPNPDPLAVVPFSSDPIFATTQHLAAPLISYPNEHDDYDKRIESAAGEAATFVGVPLRSGTVTIGLMGLIRYGMRPWADGEVQALSAIATLFAHVWSRLEAQAEVTQLAYYDTLTGLPNRQRLGELIEEIPDRTAVSLLVVDVDNMKVINDGLDFGAGDQFLRDLGSRLVDSLREQDVVARLIGDQFGVLLVDTPPERADGIARRLASHMAESVDLGGFTLSRSLSIGVAHSVDGTRHLFAEADAALHQAKTLGKKRAVTFDENMRSRALDRLETEQELRNAIAKDELSLHYQPEVDLTTGHIAAVEALLRWNHPQNGVIAAGAFIAAAEESGLIVDIGDIVLAKAIAQLKAWEDTDPELEMWINISPAQLVSRDLATQVEMLLLEHEVAPERICLEVTEHTVLDDFEVSRGTLERLRQLGVKLALDDFGTGYSSMSQLKSLPITCLKIDMSFVAGLGTSEYDSAIIDAAITLADAFGLDIVAEGIEELDQLLELTKRGCLKGQGYYLARPADPDHIVTLLGHPLKLGIAAG